MCLKLIKVLNLQPIVLYAVQILLHLAKIVEKGFLRSRKIFSLLLVTNLKKIIKANFGKKYFRLKLFI